MARILVVDDEPDVRMYVERALRLDGHDVTSTFDGFAALTELREAPYDLLLTDIAMPGMDGITLSLQAERDFPNMKILLMTGYAHERQRAHNLDELVHEVMTKPFDIETLRARVGALVNERAA
jgi:two-component system cell cycle response regulator CpdR